MEAESPLPEREVINEMADNSIDFTPVIEELQALNKGIVSSNEKLDSISAYLISKDMQQTEKDSAEYNAKLEQDQATREAQKQAEEQRSEEAETYTELLTDIRDDIRLQNQMFAGQILFIGIITGVLLAKIFFDRFRL